MKIQRLKIGKLTLNKNNPRLIRDESFKKLVKSIQNFPQMLEIRPIVTNKNLVVIGGNMRLRAAIEAGLKEVPVIVADELTPEQENEFIIKDNVSGGEWDWDILANQWDVELLNEWGLDLPQGEDDEIDSSEISSENAGNKLILNLTEEQKIIIENAIEEIKESEEFKYVETFGNEDQNTNALYLIINQWRESRR